MNHNGSFSCYLCGNPTRFMFRKRGYDIWRCPTCGLAQTDFRQAYRSFLTSFYDKGYFTGEEACGAYEDYEKDEPLIKLNTSKIFTLLGLAGESKRLLDVGCAMGYFVDEALSRGWDAYGIDVSKYAVSRARAPIGDRLKVAAIGEAAYPTKYFDRITMIDIVEHLKDPKHDLEKLRSILADDGRLIVATGDAKSWFARLMRRHWTFYTPPQHLYFFTKKTFTLLLSQTGFEPVRWYRMGKWLSLGYILHLVVTSADYPRAATLKRFVKKMGIDRIPVYLPIYDNMIVEVKKKT